MECLKLKKIRFFNRIKKMKGKRKKKFNKIKSSIITKGIKSLNNAKLKILPA